MSKNPRDYDPHRVRENIRNAPDAEYDERVVADGAADADFWRRNPPESTKLKQAAFLAAFMDSITDKEACEKAGISPRTLRSWRLKNLGDFNIKYAEAADERIRNVEALLFDVVRFFGQEEERYEKLLRYPTLALRLLSANMDKYRESNPARADDAKQALEILRNMDDTPAEVPEEAQTVESAVADLLDVGDDA